MTEDEYVEFVGKTLTGLAGMEHDLQLGCVIYLALRVLATHGQQCQVGAIATLMDQLGLPRGPAKIEAEDRPEFVN